MKEVLYKSFDGKLDSNTQNGYIIYDCKSKNTYEIEFLSISNETEKFRIPKILLSETEFSDTIKLLHLYFNADKGAYENAQTWYKNKWYSGKTIQAIQYDREDYSWKKYV